MLKKPINRLILAIFIIAACVMTFPLIIKMGTSIPGFGNTNEPYGIVWKMWWYRFARSTGLNYGNCDFIAYPSGVDFTNIAGATSIWEGLKQLLLIVANEVAAYNILILSGFFLSLLTAYLLVYRLTASRPASIFSAFIFAFSPYHFARSWQHLSLSQIQWIPLYILSLFILAKSAKKTGILISSAAFLLLVSFNFYYAYFAMVATVVFLAYFIFENKNMRLGMRLAVKIFAVFIITVVLLSPAFIDVYKKGRDTPKATPDSHNLVKRSFDDLFTQSAKPLSYLLPTSAHPVFGRFTERFIGSPLYGVSYTEHALYLGWVPLALAFIAWKRWRRSKKLSAISCQLSAEESFAVGFFVWLAIAAWMFSQPPYFSFPYFKIYTPSFFMYKVLPMFRAYCRFGVMVMLAVSVLAGFGLKALLDRFKTARGKVMMTCLFTGLVLFEFLNFPPFKVIDLMEYSKVYDWLKAEKGDFVIAEYPLDADSPNEYYKFCQTVHKKKMINGTIPGTEANLKAKTMWALSDLSAVNKLKSMGVKYVLVHMGIYENLNDEQFARERDIIKTRKIPGLKYVGNFDKVDVYQNEK